MGKGRIVLAFLFVFLLAGGAWASVDALQGTWYGADRMMDIWWCPERQAWRFEVRDSGGDSVIASGTVEEVAGASGTSYVFVTEDSRIFQASYDGACSLSVGELGTFTREECSGEGGGSGSVSGFNPCADSGVSWDNQDQPGMYVYFNEYFDQCQYELYAQGQLVDKGTVQAQDGNLTFVSEMGHGTTQGQVLDECSFSWGQAGVFRKSECGPSGGGGGGGVQPPGSGCEPLNMSIPGEMGGQIAFQGQFCTDQGTVSGTVIYQNFTFPFTTGPVTVNGQMELSAQLSPSQYYWSINGGPVYYNIPGYGMFQVSFENVEFITDVNGYPLYASGYLYVNGVPYQVTPDLFYALF